MTSTSAHYEHLDGMRLLVKGPDRAKFLHNLTTNEVKRLTPGQGREAFVTSPQGKTLGYIRYHLLDDSILVRCGQACRDAVLAHFNKYGVFDEIEIEEITEQTAEITLWGFVVSELREQPESVVRVGREIFVRDDPSGRGGVTVICPIEARSTWLSIGRATTEADFDALRIEAGTPVFGHDITPNHLPQEVGRDSQAINFVKGCYLGQETVARLDALGHVNKLLLGLIGDTPDVSAKPGDPIHKGQEEVGAITSSARSERLGRAVALGYLRVPRVSAGDVVTVADGGTFRVVALPMIVNPPPA